MSEPVDDLDQLAAEEARIVFDAFDNDAWVDRKSRVVTRFGHSSMHVGALARAAGKTFEERSRLDPDEYAAHGGSFPITVRGVGIVGAVTVSGLPQAEDHRFVVEQLDRFLGH